MYVPKAFFLTEGVGIADDSLVSFEKALRGAGIEKYNLVEVSSILPPNCKLIRVEEGKERLVQGAIVHLVMSRCTITEIDNIVMAGVGIAYFGHHRWEKEHGYIAEHHTVVPSSLAPNDLLEGAEKDKVESLAAVMLTSTVGIEVDIDACYDQEKALYVVKREGNERTIDTLSIVGIGSVEQKGKICTAVAAAVFLD